MSSTGQEQRGAADAFDHRRRLLAGFPVRERRVELAGVSTANQPDLGAAGPANPPAATDLTDERTETEMELEKQRLTTLEIAEAIAPGWERRRAFVEEVCAPLRDWMIRELRPRPGDTVLELAAGAGDTGFRVAELVGEQGHLISSDFSPAMLDVARRRGAELGVAGVDYRRIDAQCIELEDDAVDGVLCRLGYMLMADRAAALAETRRVLRPTGRLTLAVWGSPERNPFFTAVVGALIEAGHMPPPDPAGPAIFSMADPEATRALLESAGFETVHIDHVAVRFAFPDVDEYLSIIADTAGPIGIVLQSISEDDRDELKPPLQEVLRPCAGDAGYELTGEALVAAAS